MRFGMCCVVALAFVFESARADIREIKAMREILPEVTPETLLVFDLDNTLVETVQMLGSDEWYEYTVNQYVAKGGLREVAIDKALELFIKFQTLTRVRPVEIETPRLIKDEQNHGIRIMALTARPAELAGATRRQMADLAIDLSGTAPAPATLSFRVDHPVRYEGGIVYIGPKNKKGKVLAVIVKKLRFKPKKIVFVDDKKHHLVGVNEELAKLGLPCAGFRYGGADARAATFDPKITSVQERFLSEILSDDAAKYLLEKKLVD